VIILTLRFREYDREHGLVEERDAQQDSTHASGARAERAAWFRHPVLIPLGIAWSLLDPHKYQISQWVKVAIVRPSVRD
jgi:hypothetical protein